MLGAFVNLVLLWLIGFGPSLWLVRTSDRRLVHSLGIAPALGYAITALLGFPLFRYVGPIHNWALPVSALLVVLSVALAGLDWRRSPSDFEILKKRRPVLATVGFVIIGYCAAAVPIIWGGIQYAIYRTNPSDSFVFLSLSESSRVADWGTLQGGIELTQSNLSGLGKLSSASPTALFAARFLGRDLSMNGPSALAWNAELIGIPVYRYYSAFHIISMILALILTLVIGDHLGLVPVLKYLAAGAVALGFWGKFVLESDAAFEITVLPLVMLFALAWIRLEMETPRLVSPSRVLLALSGAAIARVYNPIVIPIVASFLIYYAAALVQRAVPVAAILYHGVTAAMALAAVALTGQLDLFIGDALFLATGAYAVESKLVPIHFNLMRTNGLAEPWGMPVSILFPGLLGKRYLALQLLTNGAALALTGTLILGFVWVLRQKREAAGRVILSLVAGGLAISLLALILDNARDAGKALGYIYPYLTLGVLLAPSFFSSISRPRARQVTVAFLSCWLGLQCALGIYLPTDSGLTAAFGTRPKGADYNLDPIVQYLDQHPPQKLLVNVPSDDDWAFAYYAMFVFSKYPAYFQSGILLDNTENRQSLWLDTLDQVPDQSVMMDRADYVGSAGLGERVAEASTLRLYRITTNDLRIFDDRERLIRGQDSVKAPIF